VRRKRAVPKAEAPEGPDLGLILALTEGMCGCETHAPRPPRCLRHPSCDCPQGNVFSPNGEWCEACGRYHTEVCLTGKTTCRCAWPLFCRSGTIVREHAAPDDWSFWQFTATVVPFVAFLPLYPFAAVLGWLADRWARFRIRFLLGRLTEESLPPTLTSALPWVWVWDWELLGWMAGGFGIGHALWELAIRPCLLGQR
jgi:hypothetical protein